MLECVFLYMTVCWTRRVCRDTEGVHICGSAVQCPAAAAAGVAGYLVTRVMLCPAVCVSSYLRCSSCCSLITIVSINPETGLSLASHDTGTSSDPKVSRQRRYNTTSGETFQSKTLTDWTFRLFIRCCFFKYLNNTEFNHPK